ncbi:MAG TPA: exosome complex protein Rrp42 [Candidatus Nanoarchaeia archaeon]|nr:exosome complex protein Rrp42 [Candidatus Nanoarchaeia archaeon]
MNDAVKKHIMRGLEKGVRADGRKLIEMRDISIETGASKNAEGSARVKIGDSEVIAGVKLAVESPFGDTSDQGNLMVNAELLPLSSSRFEVGPPSIEGILLARVIDRGIREAHAIDVKKLCIKQGDKVWSVSVDICTINDDGNLLDASALAAMAAIKDAVYPEYDMETNSVNYSKKTTKKLPLAKEPVQVTVHKIGTHLLIDPLPEEQELAEAQLTIATLANGEICALQKTGKAPFSLVEIEKMLSVSGTQSAELRKLL